MVDVERVRELVEGGAGYGAPICRECLIGRILGSVIGEMIVDMLVLAFVKPSFVVLVTLLSFLTLLQLTSASQWVCYCLE